MKLRHTEVEGTQTAKGFFSAAVPGRPMVDPDTAQIIQHGGPDAATALNKAIPSDIKETWQPEA